MFDRNGYDDSRYNLENIAEIAKTSPTVAALVEKEYNRQKNNVELIASENYCSEAVLAEAVYPGSMQKDILQSQLIDIPETREDTTAEQDTLMNSRNTAAISGERYSTQIIT